MQEDIKKIINIGVLAPSGDNTQPWKFEFKNNEILIINIPENDQSLYNFNQSASYISHGCLIKNLIIASSHFGYSTEVNLFPNINNKNIVASLILVKSATKTDEELFEYIEKRSSNRKQYKNTSLTEEEKKQIISIRDENTEIKICEGEEKNQLADALSINEKIVLENRSLHDFLFSHITWTKKEDEIKKGFYVETFEFSPPQKAAFNLFKNWNVLKIFNKIGVSDFISKDNAKLYKSSPAIGAIIINKSGPEEFVKAGIVLQTLWLNATRLNLSLQPLTGISFLMHRIRLENFDLIDKKHIQLIKETYLILENNLKTKGKNIIITFRIGHADEPRARTGRKIPQIIFN